MSNQETERQSRYFYVAYCEAFNYRHLHFLNEKNIIICIAERERDRQECNCRGTL